MGAEGMPVKLEGCHVVPQISIRWLTIACFEVRVGDFAIVIDPCVGASPATDFGAEVIERADLILISHGHWDHITDLEALAARCDCPILCGELTAPSLIRMLNANPARVYPMTPDLELDFGAVRVRALFARHTDQRMRLSELSRRLAENPWNDTPEKLACNFYGNLEYRNYLITAPSGLKVLFWGSNASAEQLAMARALRPDIGLMQYTKQSAEDLAALARESGMKVIFPHHMDLSQDEQTYMARVDELEKTLRAQAPGCVAIHPQRSRWYAFGLGMAAR